MTDIDRKALADRFQREHRQDRVTKIVRWLERLNETPMQTLARIDSDPLWWSAWSGALGIGAKCPSDDGTRSDVREVFRDRLPELSVAEHATDGQVYDDEADDAWDRHTDDLIAEGRGL